MKDEVLRLKNVIEYYNVSHNKKKYKYWSYCIPYVAIALNDCKELRLKEHHKYCDNCRKRGYCDGMIFSSRDNGRAYFESMVK